MPGPRLPATVIEDHDPVLDGALSSIRALPTVADVVGDRLTVLADSGVRSGLDVVRMLSSGARGVLFGRALVYALAAAGVRQLLEFIVKEVRVAMTLTGATRVGARALVG
jgi:L-lactate dehydrogenase (cytochrome)